MIVQLGNIITAHIDPIWNYIMFKRRLKNASTNPKVALTQDDLNKLHHGPYFQLPFSYAQMMSTVFVTVTFASGMPILYGITMANFAFFYFIEKFLFIRCYRRFVYIFEDELYVIELIRSPPRYSMNIAKEASRLIPIAAVLHLAMAIWVYSYSYVTK